MNSLVAWSLQLAFSMVLFGEPSGPDQMTVSVPFHFVAGWQTFPAGDYVVALSQDDPALVTLRSEDGRRFGVLATVTETRVAKSSEPTLSFERSGNQRFLSEVQIKGHTVQKVPGIDLYQEMHQFGTFGQEGGAASRKDPRAR